MTWLASLEALVIRVGQPMQHETECPEAMEGRRRGATYTQPNVEN